ncbi:hypothetical protein D0T49_01945 [Paludibacter sp. 221]|uniref:hypothetical protein n=1 Tax=Paludibacter sp. 221 TaxID=2302939 RepID=UPI0013D47FA8|nr:hypothetical protein [Paludibacter sp. 221]NDV45812.1 hypothetical protein [Paludibacter sp. 221]
MQEISLLLEKHPELVLEMVQLDNRTRIAHAELEAYNNHKVFVYKHPIVVQKKQFDEQLAELYELKRNNPGALMIEITNVTQNIRRIQSNLNKNKYKSEEEKQSWEQNLERAEIRKKVLEEVISK